MKRTSILKTLVLVFAIFLTGTLVVNAATSVPEKIKVNSTSMGYKVNPLNIANNYSYKKTSDGKFVYCMDITLLRPANTNYVKVSETKDKGVAYIVNSGVNNANTNDYFITQSALWLYLEDIGAMKNDVDNALKNLRTAVYSSQNNSNSVATKIRNLVSEAKKATSTSNDEGSLSIVTSNVSFSLDSNEEYYVSNLIKINSNIDYNVKLVNANSKVIVEEGNGGVYVKVLASSVEPGETINLKLNVNGTATTTKTYIYNPEAKGYQPVAYPVVETKTLNDSISMRLTIEKPEEPEIPPKEGVTVEISKQDLATKKELPGATLTLKNEKGEVIDKWVSTNEPHIITNLELGIYTLTEEKAPEGYTLSQETITFELKEYGVNQKVVMYNEVESVVEVPVEPTSSFATMTTSIIGLLVISLGSILIFKNSKANAK